eukprot:CAMPEP_0173378548 /NCGR_PEP_ID=MMETSP1356-20130122/1696_1 /TAXON_ID=77927 ORGANISM="Hemiselmis virescens, Strain PCC157" /NCGR_SAMPLE_ID=MMETSP1356 /ASSEMBLY_ACC=CAM_ASM_000847 /LENGTH=224 /DNA_ID=CAMNT_0014331645 /DNA_START=103 /DNA_END=777 /DNA_ORIENTATION=-
MSLRLALLATALSAGSAFSLTSARALPTSRLSSRAPICTTPHPPGKRLGHVSRRGRRAPAAASGATMGMTGMTPEEAMAVQIPEVGVRADVLVNWLWNVAQFRTDYPDCSIGFFADDAVYEDMIYAEPFVGKPAVEAFLRKTKDLAPPDFIFVMDRCSDGATAVGFTWHVELQTRPEAGKFANGASFYELDGDGKICYVRDVVEPPLKTGDFFLKVASVIGKMI